MLPTQTRLAAIAATMLLLAAPATHAAEPSDFTATTCSELAADTEESRAFALIFYYGYMAGMSGKTTVEDDKVAGHLVKVRDYCNANPTSTVVNAFKAALGGKSG
jgi:hypothetical protein